MNFTSFTASSLIIIGYIILHLLSVIIFAGITYAAFTTAIHMCDVRVRAMTAIKWHAGLALLQVVLGLAYGVGLVFVQLDNLNPEEGPQLPVLVIIGYSLYFTLIFYICCLAVLAFGLPCVAALKCCVSMAFGEGAEQYEGKKETCSSWEAEAYRRRALSKGSLPETSCKRFER